MKKIILISATFLIFAGYSFSQVLWTPGATVGNNTTNQNIGIGVSTPTNILSFGNTQAQTIWIENTTNTVAGMALTLQAGSTVIGGTSNLVGGNLILNSGLGKGTGASNIIFSTGKTLTTGNTLQTLTEAMRITGSGNVGIGITNPGSRLDIKLQAGVASYAPAATFRTNSDNSNVYIVPRLCGWGYSHMSADGDQGIFWTDGAGGAGNNSAAGFVIAPQGTNLLGIRISKDGYVGIETASPSANLDVEGASGTTLKIADGNQATGYVLTSNASGVASWASPVTSATAWQLTGNTVNAVGKYMGTNDNYDVVFQRYGTQAGLLNSDKYNTSWGVGALKPTTTGYYNTAVGYNALYSNTSATENSAFGKDALYTNSVGVANSAFGLSALYYNTIGHDNCAIGENALKYNTTGNGNIAVGDNALAGNYTGSNNLAIGNNADVSSSGLSNATAIGYGATVNSSNSIVLGNGANVGIGTSSPSEKLEVNGKVKVDNNINLHRNFLSGDGTNKGIYVNLDGCVNINYDTNPDSWGTDDKLSVNGSSFFGNTVAIYDDAPPGYRFYVAGNSLLNGKVAVYNDNNFPSDYHFFVSGKSYLDGSAQDNYTLYINGNTYGTGTGYFASDRKLKENVQNINNGLKIISRLQPKLYNFKISEFPSMKLSDGLQYGLIAQDVDSILPEIVRTVIHPAKLDSLGNILYDSIEYKAINYVALIPILIQAVKEQNMIIDSLKLKQKTTDSLQTATINSLLAHQATTDNMLTALQNCCSQGTLHKTIQNNGSQSQDNSETTLQVELANNSQPILYQNEPNPFGDNTVIRYFIPENTKGNAYIVFYDMYGKGLKKTALTTKGFGNINANTEKLATGIYSYSLIINDNVIDTKKMIKSN